MAVQFTYKMLENFLTTTKTPPELADELELLGFEINSLTTHPALQGRFLVAEITDFTKHPNADKLNICEVSTSSGKFSIVCGAPNVRKGLKTILALAGSVIPSNNMTLSNREVRGVVSNGMLCSYKELNLLDNLDGIAELPNNTPFELDICALFKDTCFNVQVTPNRGDALSVYGLARELAAKGLGTLKPLDFTIKATPTLNAPSFEVKDSGIVHGFALMNLRLQQTLTPLELVVQLSYTQTKTHSLSVDLTNYILIMLGQPMHSYDTSSLRGSLSISLSTAPVTFQGLDNIEYSLPLETIMISDESVPQKALCIAGILGGVESAVTTRSLDVTIEAGAFSHFHVMQRARRLNINTKAKYRSERFVDGTLVVTSLTYFLYLLEAYNLEFSCSKAAHVLTPTSLPILQLKNTKLPLEPRTRTILEKLGYEILDHTTNPSLGDSLSHSLSHRLDSYPSVQVKPPVWRYNLRYAEEVEEDIGRILGYDHLVALPIALPLSPKQDLVKPISVIEVMLLRGYQQVLTLSFNNKQLNSYFNYQIVSLELVNAINQHNNTLRASLIPGLLETAKANVSRRQHGFKIFEVANCFDAQGVAIPRLAALISEEENAKHDNARSINGASNKGATGSGMAQSAPGVLLELIADLFAVYGKHNLEIVDTSTTTSDSSSSVLSAELFPELHPGLHPHIQAKIMFKGQAIGIIGQIHPAVTRLLDIKAKLWAFEITNTAKNWYGVANYSKQQEVVWEFTVCLKMVGEIAGVVAQIKQVLHKYYQDHSITSIYQDEDVYKVTIQVMLQQQEELLSKAQLEELHKQVLVVVPLKL